MELNERLVLLSLQLRSEALDRNADYSANWISSGLPTIQELSDGKSVFYAGHWCQGLVFVFSFIDLLLLLLGVLRRMLLSTGFLFALCVS
jgi:hypothetical protein